MMPSRSLAGLSVLFGMTAGKLSRLIRNPQPGTLPSFLSCHLLAWAFVGSRPQHHQTDPFLSLPGVPTQDALKRLCLRRPSSVSALGLSLDVTAPLRKSVGLSAI